jgi:DNA helicase-2/ATP-dependent DNA helicase PcrA
MTPYTPAQAEAIACVDRPLQIIACAGSGKTQVISQRIAAILTQPEVKPRNVVAFTFTEKAAAELKERVLSIVERELGDVTGLAEMYIGTMHGYCLDLLQRLVPEKFKFSVLTDITAQLFVDRYSAKSGLTSCPTTASRGVLRRYVDSKLYLQVLSVLREDKIDLGRVPTGVIESFDKYMALLHENSQFDYTQIIRSAVYYLDGDQYEDDDFARVQNHIRDDIRYVVVDEYQDVNPLQERLVRSLVRFWGKSLRGWRRRPDDLSVARQSGVEHHHIRDPDSRRPAGYPGPQLPVEPRRRRTRPLSRRADPSQ